MEAPKFFDMPCARCGRANVFRIGNPERFPKAKVLCGTCSKITPDRGLK